MARIKIFTGNFGSGKTEISINYALSREKPPFLLDLDIVKPYFRLREAEKTLEKAGIDLIYPRDLVQADLPIITSEIYRALQAPEREAVLDVGGDDDGARVLGSLGQYLTPGNYELIMVINPYRPFSSNKKNLLELKDAIGNASRLEVTHFVANGNLGTETSPREVEEGYNRVESLAREQDLPIKFTAVLADLIPQVDLPGEILPVEIHLQPPWLVGGKE